MQSDKFSDFTLINLYWSANSDYCYLMINYRRRENYCFMSCETVLLFYFVLASKYLVPDVSSILLIYKLNCFHPVVCIYTKFFIKSTFFTQHIFLANG